MATVSDFLSSPLAGKRDIVVTILVCCMCMHPCIRPNLSGLIRFGFFEKNVTYSSPPSPPPPPRPTKKNILDVDS